VSRSWQQGCKQAAEEWPSSGSWHMLGVPETGSLAFLSHRLQASPPLPLVLPPQLPFWHTLPLSCLVPPRRRQDMLWGAPAPGAGS